MTSQDFDELVNEYWSHVFWIARSIVGEEEAQDATQEVFCRKWRAIGTYKPELASFKTWATRNTYHLCIDKLRSQGRRPEDAAELQDIEIAQEQHVAQPAYAQNSDWSIVISDALRSLDAQERATVLLREVEGYTLQETSVTMGLSFSQVRTLHERGIKKLRRWLAEAGIEADD